MTDEPNTIIGSIRQINGIIENLVRDIHKHDFDPLVTQFQSLKGKLNYMSETFPKLKKDEHFCHLGDAIDEFEKEKQSEERISNPNAFWPKLEGKAANILKASQRVHGESTSPFGIFGRLFR